MKAAVDSNIFFDLLSSDAAVISASEQVLSDAVNAGPVVLCPVVQAELGPGFDSHLSLLRFLSNLGVGAEGFAAEALWETARAWSAYLRRRGRQPQCQRCGSPIDVRCPSCGARADWRQHLIADFLIGGHAVAQADGLITRDPGYYRTYFPHLKLIVPVGL